MAQFSAAAHFTGITRFDGAQFARGVPDAVAQFVSAPAEDGVANPRPKTG